MASQEYHREYYQRNKDRIKAKYQERAEERREYSRRYRLEHPDKIKADNEKYRKSGKSKISVRRWRESNIEYAREQSRIYHKNHPEQRAHYERKRRARKSGCWGNISLVDWINMCNFYDNKCLCCGRGDVKLTQDHIVPMDSGGRHTIDNVQPLCGPCNTRKFTKTIDYRNGRIFIS